jgi:hypothetical protein
MEVRVSDSCLLQQEEEEVKFLISRFLGFYAKEICVSA